VTSRRCEECGFDASACAPRSVAALVDENARDWERLLIERVISPGRTQPTAWSSLEYACHVRDVYRRYDARIVLMLGEEDPLFANWDQDASATDDGYDAQDPAQVVREIREAAAALSTRLTALRDAEWARPGCRSDGASFTIDTISRYMVHDTIHHVWDVTKAST